MRSHTLLQVIRKNRYYSILPYFISTPSLSYCLRLPVGGSVSEMRTTAFVNEEAWRKNENTSSFDRLVKGALLTVEGYFKPEEWQDAEGVKHSRVILVATKFYEVEEKEESPVSQRTKTKKDK